jgi:hypothetical protein
LVLNSSIAEGLPLALGEAGLSGQCIVCTEAGGSREVVIQEVEEDFSVSSQKEKEKEKVQHATDFAFPRYGAGMTGRAMMQSKTSNGAQWKLYGRNVTSARGATKAATEMTSALTEEKLSITGQTGKTLFLGRSVSPGAPYELAMAQLCVLGVFDGVEEIALGQTQHNSAAPRLADYVQQKRFKEIFERIIEKKHVRRQLGLRFREHVIRKFSGERYLREHEQMLHVGAFQTKGYLEFRRSAFSN